MPTRVPEIKLSTGEVAEVFRSYCIVETLVESSPGVTPLVANVFPLEGVVVESGTDVCSFRKLTVTEGGDRAGARDLVQVRDDNDVAEFGGCGTNE